MLHQPRPVFAHFLHHNKQTLNSPASSLGASASSRTGPGSPAGSVFSLNTTVFSSDGGHGDDSFHHPNGLSRNGSLRNGNPNAAQGYPQQQQGGSFGRRGAGSPTSIGSGSGGYGSASPRYGASPTNSLRNGAEGHGVVGMNGGGVGPRHGRARGSIDGWRGQGMGHESSPPPPPPPVSFYNTVNANTNVSQNNTINGNGNPRCIGRAGFNTRTARPALNTNGGFPQAPVHPPQQQQHQNANTIGGPLPQHHTLPRSTGPLVSEFGALSLDGVLGNGSLNLDYMAQPFAVDGVVDKDEHQFTHNHAHGQFDAFDERASFDTDPRTSFDERPSFDTSDYDLDSHHHGMASARTSFETNPSARGSFDAPRHHHHVIQQQRMQQQQPPTIGGGNVGPRAAFESQRFEMPNNPHTHHPQQQLRMNLSLDTRGRFDQQQQQTQTLGGGGGGRPSFDRSSTSTRSGFGTGIFSPGPSSPTGPRSLNAQLGLTGPAMGMGTGGGVNGGAASPTDSGSYDGQDNTFKTCIFCDTELHEGISLHNKLRHPFACQICRTDIASQRELDEHNVAVHGRNVPCTDCGRAFAKHHHLAQHMRDAHKYPCPRCNKIANSRAAFEAHVKDKHPHLAGRVHPIALPVTGQHAPSAAKLEMLALGGPVGGPGVAVGFGNGVPQLNGNGGHMNGSGQLNVNGGYVNSNGGGGMGSFNNGGGVNGMLNGGGLSMGVQQQQQQHAIMAPGLGGMNMGMGMNPNAGILPTMGAVLGRLRGTKRGGCGKRRV